MPPDPRTPLLTIAPVSILVFNQAEERGWYADRSSIDIGLLKTIRRMVAGLEVRSCTAKQWQQAICQGYAVFRELKKNGGGDVTVDLDKQRITYRLSSSAKGTSSIIKGRRA